MLYTQNLLSTMGRMDIVDTLPSQAQAVALGTLPSMSGCVMRIEWVRIGAVMSETLARVLPRRVCRSYTPSSPTAAMPNLSCLADAGALQRPVSPDFSRHQTFQDKLCFGAGELVRTGAVGTIPVDLKPEVETIFRGTTSEALPMLQNLSLSVFSSRS